MGRKSLRVLSCLVQSLFETLNRLHLGLPGFLHLLSGNTGMWCFGCSDVSELSQYRKQERRICLPHREDTGHTVSAPRPTVNRTPKWCNWESCAEEGRRESALLSLSILGKNLQRDCLLGQEDKGEFRIAPRWKPWLGVWVGHILKQGESEKDQRGQSQTELLQTRDPRLKRQLVMMVGTVISHPDVVQSHLCSASGQLWCGGLLLPPL